MIIAVMFFFLCIEFSFHPRFDVTSENDLLLWYSKFGKRTYAKICKL